MKFTLTITLGNDAMQTPDDVAAALAHVAHRVRASDAWGDPTHAGHLVLDDNGNRVGEWAVSL